MTTTPRRIWRDRDRIEIREAELIQHLTQCPRGSFGKIHLSNLPDWMDQDQCGTVLTLVNEEIARAGRAVWRFLHGDRRVPGSLAGSPVLDRELGGELELADRFVLRHPAGDLRLRRARFRWEADSCRRRT